MTYYNDMWPGRILHTTESVITCTWGGLVCLHPPLSKRHQPPQIPTLTRGWQLSSSPSSPKPVWVSAVCKLCHDQQGRHGQVAGCLCNTPRWATSKKALPFMRCVSWRLCNSNLPPAWPNSSSTFQQVRGQGELVTDPASQLGRT